MDTPSATTPPTIPELPPLTPGWEVLVLVCKACRKRSSGPKSPKPKELAAALRQAGKEQKVKTRAVLTSCMGLCPRDATAVTTVPRHGDPQSLAWPAKASADRAAQLLAAATGGAARPRG